MIGNNLKNIFYINPKKIINVTALILSKTL